MAMIPTLALPFPPAQEACRPAELGSQHPPTFHDFFDGEVKRDVNKIEEFLEEKLAPARWASSKPVLATRLSLFPIHRQF